MNLHKHQGQTLIETIVAIFILTTSLTASLALTVYVFANSARSLNEITATNLAKEGVDVIRNIRDTNWLESDDKGGPWGLTACTLAGKTFNCYPRAWEGVPGNGYHHYDISLDGNYQVVFNSSTNTWTLDSSPSSFAIYKQADGSYNSTVNGFPVFARKVTLTHNSNPPFGAGSLSEITVTSTVGWTGKGCSTMTNFDPTTTNCSVAISERLTNWKDYR
jgi:type II secretory pathway pseudopilin PulG